MCFNIGVIIGPILGGLLADPAGSYPDMFGGIGWLLKFPYAPPNILSACFLLTAATGVFLGLEEVKMYRFCVYGSPLMFYRPLNPFVTRRT
jgi:hypothetical protein